MTALLAPFDDETQSLLKRVDIACQKQQQQLKEEASRQSLAGKPLEVDMETIVWITMIKAYGILYNRGIDAGWINDIHLDEVEGR